MADPNKVRDGINNPSSGALPGAALIQEMINEARGGNRTVLPPRVIVPTQTGNGIPVPSSPFNSQPNPNFEPPIPGRVIPGSVPGGLPLPALPRPSSSAETRPNYIPPAVFPASRRLPDVPAIAVDTPTSIADKVPFPFSSATNKVETASGTLGFGVANTLVTKVLGLAPLTKQAIPFGPKFLLGLPASVLGSAIAGGEALGTGEERDIALRIAGVNLGRELAEKDISALTAQDRLNVNQFLADNPRAAQGVIEGFNDRAAENARLLAAGLGVDAARAIVGGDLSAVAGLKAAARREAFVAGLLGLILPNSELGADGINPPRPWRGDP